MHFYPFKLKAFTFVFIFVLTPTVMWAQQTDSAAVEATPAKAPAGVPLTGTITDADNNQSLAGISVSIPGFSAALTDDNGNFTLNVPNYSATVTISGEGQQTRQIALKGRQSIQVSVHDEAFRSVYDMANLPHSQKPLNQTVHSLASLNLADKWQYPYETPDNYLQGRIAGLNVTRRSGTPGIGSILSLRGINSLNTTNQPLVVVDGMIFDMNDYGGSLIGNYFSNPLANIDLKDVDNITFIKDAASMYGSKAANGVLLITTAHPEELTTKIDFAVYGGMNFRPKSLPLLDASEHRTYLSDILKTRGWSDDQIQAQPYMNDDINNPIYYRYHNNKKWQDEVLANSYTSNYYMKVTGGDNIARYGLSLGYLDQDGIIQGTDYKRYNTRFNADYRMSPKLRASSNLGFTYNEHTLKDQGLFAKTNPLYLALIKSPFLAQNEISDQGVVSPNLADADIFNIGNPRALVQNMNARNNNYRFFGSVGFNYDLTRVLKINSLFGITYDKLRENVFVPRLGTSADTLANGVAESRMSSQVQRLFSLYNDTYLSYDKYYGTDHTVAAKLGFRYSNNRTEEDYGIGYNSATDELQTIGTGSTALRQTGGDIGKWTWLNYYTTVDYGYKSKYFINFNLAMDGSSRFGKEAESGVNLFNNSFGLFPSLGAAWLVSSENFMANVNAIEMLKLRASYGLTGNDDIGNYTARQIYVSQNFLGQQGIVRSNIANYALQWETHKKLNVGFDAALLNERVTLSLDVYHNQTNNMLTMEPAGTVAGFDFTLSNNGGMKNQGIELALNSRLLNTLVKWDAGIILSKNRNELTKLPGGPMLNSIAGATIISQVGQPANAFYGFKTNGVYATDEEARTAGLTTRLFNGALANFQGGDVRFINQDENSEINDDDRVVIGNPNPDFTGMISSRWQYKGFALDAAFTFSYGNDVFNYTRAQLESMQGPENQTKLVRNRWVADGQVTNTPRAAWGDPMGNARFSDRWIEDGSYLRLRNLSLTYSLPITQGFLKSSSIYLTGINLVTFSKYLGYDPEFSASNNRLSQGIDTTLEPQYRSVLLGFRLGL